MFGLPRWLWPASCSFVNVCVSLLKGLPQFFGLSRKGGREVSGFGLSQSFGGMNALSRRVGGAFGGNSGGIQGALGGRWGGIGGALGEHWGGIGGSLGGHWGVIGGALGGQ